MKRLFFCVAFIALMFPACAQQTKAPVEYGYTRGMDVKKTIKHKLEIFQRQYAFLKGGIWDEILPNIVYVPQAHVIKSFEGFDSINPANKEWTMLIPGFYILNTEVTNKMYRYFLVDSTDAIYQPHFGEDSSIATADLKDYFAIKKDGEKYKLANYKDLDDYPVVGISWKAAHAFCSWLSAQRHRVFIETKDSSLLMMGFRLPTEAEFESAAIMDEMDDEFTWKEFKETFHQKLFSNLTDEGMNYGQIIDADGTVERDFDNDGYYFTNPVKKFPSGRLGLYGIEGNAAEWMLDTYSPISYDWHIKMDSIRKLSMDSAYKEYYRKNPRGPYGNYHVVKGGSWFDPPFYLQPCVRQKYYERKSSERIGFRLVCTDMEDSLFLKQKEILRGFKIN